MAFVGNKLYSFPNSFALSEIVASVPILPKKVCYKHITSNTMPIFKIHSLLYIARPICGQYWPVACRVYLSINYYFLVITFPIWAQPNKSIALSESTLYKKAYFITYIVNLSFSLYVWTRSLICIWARFYCWGLSLLSLILSCYLLYQISISRIFSL